MEALERRKLTKFEKQTKLTNLSLKDKEVVLIRVPRTLDIHKFQNHKLSKKNPRAVIEAEESLDKIIELEADHALVFGSDGIRVKHLKKMWTVCRELKSRESKTVLEESSIKRQPEGLKMRYFPIGYSKKHKSQ